MCELDESEQVLKGFYDTCISEDRVDFLEKYLRGTRPTFRLNRLYTNVARFMRLRKEMAECATR